MSFDLTEALAGQMLAIDQSRLQAILARGEQPKAATPGRWDGAADRQARGVAVLPLLGFLDQRDSWLLQIFGGTSTDAFGRQFDSAIADPAVSAIVLDIDSPGGTVAGTPELAQKIYNARGKKPITAVVNSLATSAAYWVASAADRITATPSGQVGSIGVVMVHAETSKADEEAGITYTILRSTQEKYEGNNLEPLSDSAKSYLQGQINTLYQQFLSDVARNRGTSADVVGRTYGGGRTKLAKAALASGMVDSVGTFDSTIRESLMSPKQRAAAAFARREGVIRALQAESPATVTQKQMRQRIAELGGKNEPTADDRAQRLAELAGEPRPSIADLRRQLQAQAGGAARPGKSVTRRMSNQEYANDLIRRLNARSKR